MNVFVILFISIWLKVVSYCSVEAFLKTRKLIEICLKKRLLFRKNPFR